MLINSPDRIKVLDDREHIMLRPQMYVGDNSTFSKRDWVLDKDEELDSFVLQYKTIPFNVAFFKLFDEIISNGVDEYIKTNGKFGNKIKVWLCEKNHFIVQDNGRGLCTSGDDVLNAFTQIRAGSNFESDDTKVNTGTNGAGAMLVNIFSTYFNVVTDDGEGCVELTCRNNCHPDKTELFTSNRQPKRGTRVESIIDESRFTGSQHITKNQVKYWLYKRLLEIRSCYPEIKIWFNDAPVEYCLTDLLPLKGVLNKNEGRQVGIYLKNNKEEDNISYVNCIHTYEEGTHVDFCKRIIFDEFIRLIKKQFKIEINKNIIKDNILIYVNISSFKHAVFHSQNKTKLITNETIVSEHITENFINKAIKQFFDDGQEIKELVERLEQEQNKKILSQLKPKKNVKVENFIDALDKDRKDTILFLTEGLSAKAQFLSTRDKNKHGMIALRGKILNVYDTPLKKIVENAEIKSLLQVLNLQIGKKANDVYFDKIGILTDADPDGDNITALLLILFYKFWPELFAQGKIIKVYSPLNIAWQGKKVYKRFYDMDVYKQEYKKLPSNCDIKFYKGLGRLPLTEYAFMLNNMKYDVITLDDVKHVDEVLRVLFGSNSDIRKQWLQDGDI